MRLTILVFAVVVVLLIGVRLAVRPPRQQGRPTAPAAAPGLFEVSFPRPGQAVAILPVTRGLSLPGTARLADELAGSVLASFKDARAVEVRTLGGESLGTRRRSRLPEIAAARSAPLPERGGPPATPLLLHSPSPAEASVRVEPPVRQSLADRLALPPVLRAGVVDPDDQVDVVEQILRAGGHNPDRSANLLRLDGQILIVLRVPVGSLVERDALNRAYAQFRDSGSFWGLVVAAGFFPSREIARRQAIDPHLRHAGFSDLQRMADAAAAGADPLDFTVAPGLTRTIR